MSKVKVTPIKERGRVNKIRKGCHSDSNSEAITINTKVIASIKAKRREEKDSFMLSPSPPIITLYPKGIVSLSITSFTSLIT